MPFPPYGEIKVTVTGHEPSEHCLQKTVGETGYFLLSHCSQRIWEDADLLKYKVKTKFTAATGWKLDGEDTVEVDYKLPKKANAKAADAHEMQVATFKVFPDETSEYGVARKREPGDPTLRVVFQTPTIELTLHSPSTIATRGDAISRPQSEADDVLTVDGERIGARLRRHHAGQCRQRRWRSCSRTAR